MSLEVVIEPYEISLARNPIPFHLKTNNLFIEDSVFPILNIVFATQASTGDGFSFSITDPDSGKPIFFLFSAAAVVDNEGWIYNNNAVGGALVAYVGLVYAQLLKNKLLASYFSVVYDGNLTIQFIALKASADLIPVNPNEIQFYGDGIYADHLALSVTSTWLDKARRANYRVLLDVYFEDEYKSNQWRKVATLKDEPDTDGNCSFDISSVLNAELKESFDNIPAPSLLQTKSIKGNNVKRYYVAWCDYYDGQPDGLFWNADKPKLVHTGAVSVEDFSKQNAFQYIFSKSQFLTWQPNKKQLCDNQNDWLTWINYVNEVKTVKAQIKLYYTDGTASAQIDILDSLEVQPWEEILIPVGYTQRGIEAIADGVGKNCYKWEIRVISGTTALSEIRTFYRIDGPYLHNNELCYLNAFGCPETLTTTGIWEERTTVAKQFTERALATNYNLINGQEFQFDQQTKNNYEANTGYMSKAFITALRDIIIQTDVFLLENNEYIPVIIAPGEFSITSSLEFLNQLKLSIRRSFKVGAYSVESRIPQLTPVIDCGFVGFTLASNNTAIAVYSTMKVSLNGATIHAAVAHAGDGYTFPAVIITEGIYRIEVTFTLTSGEVIKFDFNYNYRLAKAFIEFPDLGYVGFYARALTGLQDKWAVDWGSGDIYSTHTITDSFVLVDEVMIHMGIKRGIISSTCPLKIKQINLYSNTGAFDLSIFSNIELFHLFYASTTGTVDLSAFKKLTYVVLIGNLIDGVNVGFHPNITNFEFQENQLDEFAIEAILLQIWNYRKYYLNTGIYLNFMSNPGSGSMTATALAIINGTGEFVDEGLASDYTFSITY